MSDDSFTEVTTESWFSRLGNAFKGILVGIILFLVSFPLLWLNEGRAVKTARDLEELGGKVVSASVDKVDAANEGQPVHLSGTAATNATLEDAEFPIKAKAVKLLRRVEMYQWKEHIESETHKRVGGSTETRKKPPTYEKTWSDEPIDSGKFKQTGHDNPASFRFAKAEQIAGDVRLGAFEVPAELLKQWKDYKPLAFETATIDKLPEPLKEQSRLQGDRLYLPNDPAGSVDPASPKIGDLRVWFETVQPGPISILARQVGNTLSSWKGSNGSAIERLEAGLHSAEDMVKQMESENNMLTWILRLVGFLLMAFGIGLVLNPLAVLADVLPILGDLMQAGIALVAILVAGALSLVTIALAWLAYRPVLGIGLLVAAVVLVFLLRSIAGRRKAAATAG